VRYTVVWSPDAERELARVWNHASDRGGITNAANFLDRERARDPNNLGESRPSGIRIAHWLPLGIRFAISEDDRFVRVLAVWECRRLAGGS
jgi:plasmid stabilization system protein ParE